MTTQQAKIKDGISLYLNPILILFVGYFLKAQTDTINARLQRLENNTETIIELRTRSMDIERRLSLLESKAFTMAAKHEDTYYLTDKLEYV
jgi:hypothetical protein